MYRLHPLWAELKRMVDEFARFADDSFSETAKAIDEIAPIATVLNRLFIYVLLLSIRNYPGECPDQKDTTDLRLVTTIKCGFFVTDAFVTVSEA